MREYLNILTFKFVNPLANYYKTKSDIEIYIRLIVKLIYKLLIPSNAFYTIRILVLY